MRVAPLTGVYGISFVFAMTAAALALVLLRRPRLQLVPLLALPVLIFLPPLPSAGVARETVVALQPAIADDTVWTRFRARSVPEELAQETIAEANRSTLPKPELSIWPEVPAPFYYERDPRFARIAAAVATSTKAPFLFGTVAFTRGGAPLNSAQMLDAAGKPVDRYDKIELVPFGEFVPPLFGWINKVSSEAGDFVAGNRMVVFPVDGHKLGAFICYESAFPHLIRQFAAQGAEAFANLSNDGYFGDSAAREQHLELVRMRAAENRRWVVRVTNDGITASVDPAGRVVRTFPSFREIAGRLPFDWTAPATPYSRYGDWFAWSCLASGLAACAFSLWQGRRTH